MKANSLQVDTLFPDMDESPVDRVSRMLDDQRREAMKPPADPFVIPADIAPPEFPAGCETTPNCIGDYLRQMGWDFCKSYGGFNYDGPIRLYWCSNPKTGKGYSLLAGDIPAFAAFQQEIARQDKRIEKPRLELLKVQLEQERQHLFMWTDRFNNRTGWGDRRNCEFSLQMFRTIEAEIRIGGQPHAI